MRAECEDASVLANPPGTDSGRIAFEPSRQTGQTKDIGSKSPLAICGSPTQRATKDFSVAKPPKVGYVIHRNPPMSLPYCLP